eukprot:jgi/Botrbrau1/13944/Bobra.0193s0009.1
MRNSLTQRSKDTSADAGIHTYARVWKKSLFGTHTWTHTHTHTHTHLHTHTHTQGHTRTTHPYRNSELSKEKVDETDGNACWTLLTV